MFKVFNVFNVFNLFNVFNVFKVFNVFNIKYTYLYLGLLKLANKLNYLLTLIPKF